MQRMHDLMNKGLTVMLADGSTTLPADVMEEHDFGHALLLRVSFQEITEAASH